MIKDILIVMSSLVYIAKWSRKLFDTKLYRIFYLTVAIVHI